MGFFAKIVKFKHNVKLIIYGLREDPLWIFYFHLFLITVIIKEFYKMEVFGFLASVVYVNRHRVVPDFINTNVCNILKTTSSTLYKMVSCTKITNYLRFPLSCRTGLTYPPLNCTFALTWRLKQGKTRNRRKTNLF